MVPVSPAVAFGAALTPVNATSYAASSVSVTLSAMAAAIASETAFSVASLVSTGEPLMAVATASAASLSNVMEPSAIDEEASTTVEPFLTYILGAPSPSICTYSTPSIASSSAGFAVTRFTPAAIRSAPLYRRWVSVIKYSSSATGGLSASYPACTPYRNTIAI